MAVTTIIDGSAASPAVSTDDGNTVVLRSREPSRSGDKTQTVDVWEGTTAAILEFFEEMNTHRLIDSITPTQNGGKATLRIVWSVLFTAGETPDDDPDADEDEGEEWGTDFIEIPTPLAAHPYFQTSYVEGAGSIIEDEIARCDSAIKRGRTYTPNGPYADWVGRYYALRMAGVEEWTQYGIAVSRRFTTDNRADAVATVDDMGQVIAAAQIGMPQSVRAVIDNVPKILDYATALPSSHNLIRGDFEFVQRPPQIMTSIVNNVERYDITLTWWGVARWSAVIYPGGTWDPTGLDDGS